MAFNLDKLTDAIASVDVEYGDQTLNVIYKPNAVTTEFADEMQKAEKKGDINAFARGASQLVVDWDLTTNGKNVKPSYDFLRTLPLTFLGAIFGAIMDEATGDTDEDAKND